MSLKLKKVSHDGDVATRDGDENASDEQGGNYNDEVAWEWNDNFCHLCIVVDLWFFVLIFFALFSSYIIHDASMVIVFIYTFNTCLYNI